MVKILLIILILINKKKVIEFYPQNKTLNPFNMSFEIQINISEYLRSLYMHHHLNFHQNIMIIIMIKT